MKLLIDECVPRKFKFNLTAGGHVCSTVQEAGFAGKKNGELLQLADGNFDVLLTLDRNIRYQQSLSGRRISVLIIRSKSSRLADVRLMLSACLAAIDSVAPGTVAEVELAGVSNLDYQPPLALLFLVVLQRSCRNLSPVPCAL